jgi:hypothetical protein
MRNSLHTEKPRRDAGAQFTATLATIRTILVRPNP